MTIGWFWRSLSLNNRSGSDVFAALFLNKFSIATLLESPVTSTENRHLTRYSICAGSPRIVNGQQQLWTPPLGEVLPFLEQLLHKRHKDTNNPNSIPPSPFDYRSGFPHPPSTIAQVSPISPSPHLPFTGGWLGWLGYDVAWEVEDLPYYKSDPLPFPVAFWYEPESFAVLDHWEQVLWLASSSINGLDEMEEKLSTQQDLIHTQPLSPPIHQLCMNREDYAAAVNQAKRYIELGDIFQANLSLRFESHSQASGWEIYRALQKINPSPMSSFWRSPWGEVVSCSPERLVQLRDGLAQTRPIAGTRQRGKTLIEDQQLAQDLLSNTKERAEHIMLVDLQRNDLGRVCEWGSVEVDELLSIERYSHVMHLVSNVRGCLGKYTPVDLIRAMFPGGTITGCPKVRCMEIIEELEPVRRSLFYGSCGYLDWRGNLDLNILIRTLLVDSGWEDGEKKENSTSTHKVWGQVGAGIVADSDPRREWDESLQKAQAQIDALCKGMRG